MTTKFANIYYKQKEQLNKNWVKNKNSKSKNMLNKVKVMTAKLWEKSKAKNLSIL